LFRLVISSTPYIVFEAIYSNVVEYELVWIKLKVFQQARYFSKLLLAERRNELQKTTHSANTMYLAVAQLSYSIHTTLRTLVALPVPSYAFHNQFIVELLGNSLVPDLFCILTRSKKKMYGQNTTSSCLESYRC
jgi:hypothetical protein